MTSRSTHGGHTDSRRVARPGQRGGRSPGLHADHINVAAAAQRGITVTFVEDLLTEPTAELAVTLLLAATRRVREGDQVVRSGRFGGWRPELYGLGLSGAQVGLVGFGAVGQAIARRLTGFGCQLVHTDPAATANHHQGSRRVGLGELVTSSDAIVISAPLLPETVGMVGRPNST